jgi:L-amino acid N-acyltransferase YncA
MVAVISGIAVKPSRRRQGIGLTVLRQILSLHQRQGLVEHVAYISVRNPAGRGCAEKAGFVPTTSEPDEHGFIEFHHRQLVR